MRSLIVILLFVVGCRSECYDYAVFFCDRVAICNFPPGARDLSTEDCRDSFMEGVQAGRRTEESCRTARERLLKQSCAEFVAELQSVLE